MFAREGYFGSAFAAATFHGNLDVVNYFLESGADPSLQGLKFGSVLQTAAAGGSTAVVKALLDSGADVNAQGGEYNTALVAAASLEYDTIVTLLIKHGADLSIGSSYHGSSLYQAASTGDTKMVLTLLGAGADMNHVGDSDGTPLYAAALSGSVSLVQNLLSRGAEVNKGGPGEYGYPLVAAAHNGHAQIVRTLLRAGANPNPESVATTIAAINSSDMPTFRAVLDGGANLNTPDQTYVNPLHAAFGRGELEMAKILLERGAEFEDMAFLRGVSRFKQDSYFMKKMLTMNPNIDAHAGREGSALHLALNESCEEAAWLILERDPYIHAVSDYGSALSVAISKDMTKVAQELLRRGADINGRTTHNTGKPFDIACWRGNLEIAATLLKKGADINIEGGEP